MKNLLSVLLLLCPFLAFTSTSARAESVTYTFTGSSYLTGTSFTYVDPDGFLSFGTSQLIPTNAANLFVFGQDYGQIETFDFKTAHTLFISASAGALDGGASTYNLNTFGIQDLGTATLDIEPTVAVTPEPSSVLLLATGALGLIAPLRRRFVRA